MHKPVSVGLFACEKVIIEEKTGNITLVNCFSLQRVEQFPSEPFPFVLFAILTNGAGQMPLKVSIQRLDTLDEIYQRSVSLRIAHPLQEVRCLFRIRNCSFPVSGHYSALLFADNELVAQRKFHILQKENPQ